VRCRDATARSLVVKVRGEVFAHFHAVAVKVAVICAIHCLARHDEFFVNNPRDVKKNYEYVLAFLLLLHPSLLFPSQWVWPFRIWLMPSSQTLICPLLGSPLHNFRDLHVWCCSFVGSIAKSQSKGMDVGVTKFVGVVSPQLIFGCRWYTLLFARSVNI
jgi:hypothetical protein